MIPIGNNEEFERLTHDSPITVESLQPYRQLGDPLADETIAAIFSTGEEGLRYIHRLLKHLVKNDHPLLDDPENDEERLPDVVVEQIQKYFDESDRQLETMDSQLIVAGEKIFADHGPEILLLLATYSLPASYTAKRGVQVLAQTGRLESEPVRRLIETTQMVIDVMAPGGLAAGDSAKNHGKGIRTAQKVRLMHAAIRRLILERYSEEWVKDYGVPINQMDLCGTLMTFSAVIFDGLRMLRVKLTPEQEAQYLYAWRAIGAIMGVTDELIPQTVERAQTFKEVIRKSEIGKCEAGIDLTNALVKAYQSLVEPDFLDGLPIALMDRFLGEFAEVLDLPKPGWTRFLVSILVTVSGWLDAIHRSFTVTQWLHRKFSMVFIRLFLRMERGGNRPSFNIPDELADGWGVADL